MFQYNHLHALTLTLIQFYMRDAAFFPPEAHVNYVTRVASPELNYSSMRMEELTFYVGIPDAAIMHPNVGSVSGRAK